jgi:phosphatidylglycerol lysyltransferase
VLKRGERAGISFAIVPAADLPLILDELETVSRDWLQAKYRHEKGFSLGGFDVAYLGEFDCAVVRQEGRIIAFGNIWLGASLHESSMDLMRHRSDAPKGTMMFLILSLMLWAQRSGCAWFNLGMAPLAGLTRHRLAPRWHAIGRIIFRHGERLYGFNGLRRFKAQFHPVWRSRYVVCRPGTITLALALADCARRISRSPVHRLSTPFRAGGGA